MANNYVLFTFFASAVQKDTSDKEWVCFGNMFLKLSKAQTRTLLKKGAELGLLLSSRL